MRSKGMISMCCRAALVLHHLSPLVVFITENRLCTAHNNVCQSVIISIVPTGFEN